MSFQKRFLSIGLIIASAKGQDGFLAFEKFMLYPAHYTYTDEESSILHQIYIKYQDSRKNLWILIGNQETKKNGVGIAIKAICKCWKVVKNEKNEKDHKRGIVNYLHLVENCDPNFKVVLSEIIQDISN